MIYGYIGGVWCSNDEILKREALSFFKKLFQSHDQCHPKSLQLSSIHHVSLELYNSLIIPISVLDVRDAIFSMTSYKALGVHGFQPVFFKTYWDVVGNDVWQMVATTFNTRNFDPSLVEMLIVPIPKIDTPTSFRDFRQISLCNVLFKTMSRIRPHLDSLIGLLQSSFIPKRGTSDNALIAQEIIHHMHKKKGKKAFIMFKIYFEKAYDRVDWDFLLLTLKDFGFPPPTIKLLMNCTMSTNIILEMEWKET